MLKIERRLEQPRWLSVAVPIASVGVSFLVMAAVLGATGHDLQLMRENLLRRVKEYTIPYAMYFNPVSRAEQGIDFLARRLLCRPFRPEELVIVKASLADLRQHYKANPADAKSLIAFGESKQGRSLRSKSEH